MSNNQPRRGILSRVRTYGVGRIRDERLFAKSRKNISGAISAIGEAVTPVSADPQDIRKGLSGRYADGGVGRFRAEMGRRNLNGRQLDRIAAGHLRIAMIFLAAASGSFALAAWWMLSGHGLNGFLYGLAIFIAVLVFVALSLRHDYSAWQIRERRFGGFRDYVQGRFG